MSPCVLTFVRLALLLLAGCVGATAPPALILQLSQITRARVTKRTHEQRHELAFSAAISVGLETVAGLPIGPQSRDPPIAEPDTTPCEPIGSAICAWAHAAEESAWLAAIEHEGLPP